MPRATVVKFRWDTPADRDWLARRREDVLALAYRTACDAVRIGSILEDVKSRLKHGEYQEWVLTELPFSVQTAHKYRQVAAAFRAYETSRFEMFDTSALVVLSQLTTPQTAREHAVQLAKEGQRVTHALALEILDAHRDPDSWDKEEEEEDDEDDLKMLRCLGVVRDDDSGEMVQCPVEFLTTAGLRFCAKCRKRAEGDAPAKTMTAEMAQKRWRVVSELADACSEVRIAKLEDHDDEEPLYSVTCHRTDDHPRVAVRRDLYDALSVLAGREETRYCSGCKSDVPLGLFGANALNPKGLMYRCRPCEKKRRAAMRAEAKRLREVGEPRPACAAGFSPTAEVR